MGGKVPPKGITLCHLNTFDILLPSPKAHCIKHPISIIDLISPAILVVFSISTVPAYLKRSLYVIVQQPSSDQFGMMTVPRGDEMLSVVARPQSAKGEGQESQSVRAFPTATTSPGVTPPNLRAQPCGFLKLFS